MPGTDKSRGYCLDMICADFVAGQTSTMRTPRCPCSPCHGSSNSCLANKFFILVPAVFPFSERGVPPAFFPPLSDRALAVPRQGASFIWRA